jgi:putative SOS response-associated peptidase YedK
MCGRYTQTAAAEDLLSRFGLHEQGVTVRPRYNLAPSQEAPVVVNEDSKMLRLMRWGLVPSWAKDSSIGDRMINARAETITEKPSFRRLVFRSRCLVPADGFYEWRKVGRGKVPMRMLLKSRELFSFAGLWDRWKKPDGTELESFTIITTEANDLIKHIHNRMPVILRLEDEERWLDPDLKETAELTSFLKPYPPDKMEAYSVSRMVNSPVNDIPECIVPASVL